MSSLPTSPEPARFQKALLLPASVPDDYGGWKVLGDPIELDVRWEQGEKEGIDPSGNVIAVAAEVWVDREIALGSLMWYGGLDQLPGTALLPESKLMKVVNYTETPDVEGRYVERTVALMRHGDTAPV